MQFHPDKLEFPEIVTKTAVLPLLNKIEGKTFMTRTMLVYNASKLVNHKFSRRYPMTASTLTEPKKGGARQTAALEFIETVLST
jgi:hypothetical protein